MIMLEFRSWSLSVPLFAFFFFDISSVSSTRFRAKITPGDNDNAEAELNRVFTKESFSKVYSDHAW